MVKLPLPKWRTEEQVSTVARDFHIKPFDEGTRIKLELLRDYTREWLPVWLSLARPDETITIADFFAGPGGDVAGHPGTPQMILDELRNHHELIQKRRARARLIFYEASESKCQRLQAWLQAQPIPRELCAWSVGSLRFEEAFSQAFPKLKQGPNLLILDQQGVKEVSDEVFKKILRLKRTDFLFFIASSSIRRFENHPYFQRHLKIPTGAVSGTAFNDTHRAVTRYYRDLAGLGADRCFLGSFSIRKGSNIYGLIFGSHHLLGLEKFLRVCWKADPERGEANFDIDDDRLDSSAPHLFRELDQPKKKRLFQEELRKQVVAGDLKTDGDVYLYTLQEGFLPADGRQVLRELHAAGAVRVLGGQPRVSMKGYHEPRRVEVLKLGTV